MPVIQSSNPCLCVQSTPNNPAPTQVLCDPTKCLCICDIYIGGDDPENVAPCGVEGSILITDYEHDFAICGAGDVYYKLITSDSNFFEAAAVNGAGVFTWTVKQDAPLVGTATLLVSCGKYGNYFNITVVKKNLCQGVLCPGSQVCNPCDGECVADLGENEGVIVDEAGTFVIPQGKTLEYAILLSDVNQSVQLGTTEGGIEIADEFVVSGEPSVVSVLYYASDGDVTVYVTSEDSITVRYRIV